MLGAMVFLKPVSNFDNLHSMKFSIWIYMILSKTFDNHSLIVTALKNLLLKGNAKTKLYRDYSSLNIDHFKEDLGNNFWKTI